MMNDNGNKAGDRDGAEGASGAERLTAPPDDTRRPRLSFPVVGIGASAGGLEAYTEFLQACPPDADMAYVLIQHLPPDRESLLTEILSKQTPMPVLEVKDGQTIEPNAVYIIRPGHTLTIQGGRLRLGPELAARGHGRPVDDFFRSLAEEQQQRAVAVVFSGMGSNGTAGAQAVKAVGGLVIAQEPDSAKFPAMPRGLIDAHLPDYILRPSEIPDALIRYAVQPYAADDEPTPIPGDEQALGDLLAVLRTRTRHDFSGYRKPTLLRRVRRRMGLGQFEIMADYVRTLRQTPAEVTALTDDLLIHVTGFFRDPEAWETLREKVIEPLTADRPDGAEVRCWVSACATGEEAYTLAMLLVEAAETRSKRFDIKVFATDMAERALGAARAGVFPNGIESEVTPERLARFFNKDDSFYQVRKELRELVIFAPQNVLHDPPFSRLDVVTCRNLLIYLEPATQRRVLALLHFGLREGGALMLGSSESAGMAEGDFEPIDKRYRIFRRLGPTRPGTLDLPALVSAAREIRPSLPLVVGRQITPTAPVAAQLVSRALLDRHTPAAVAVDSGGLIVHVHGDTSRYLVLPAGSPSLDLMAMANDQVRGAVRSALHRAIDIQAPAIVRDGLIDTSEGRRRVEVEAAPLGLRGGPSLYMLIFRDYAEPPVPISPPDIAPSSANPLADELQRVRNELQGALEEMQTSNEELKASHEEATSLNEELQSTNEELETSKEEMQSLNEELVTVNAQLQAKMSELEAAANDLGSLLTSTDIAVLFLDPKIRIRRFTPAVKDLLDLIPSDIGRPFVDLRLKFADPDLLADAHKVLDKLVPVERVVESESGRSYLRRILPYRTQDNRIDGVVVAFVDVTERRKADEALRASEEKHRALFESIDEGVCFIERLPNRENGLRDYRYMAMNRAMRAIFGGEDLTGRTIRDCFPYELEAWYDDYDRVLETGQSVRLEQESEPQGKILSMFVSRVEDGTGKRLVAVMQDVTDRIRDQAEREQLVAQLTEADRRKDDFLAMLAHELRNPLSAISNASALLGTPKNSDSWAQEVISRQSKQLTRLIDDLLDITRISRGKMYLKRERLDAVPVLSRAVQAAQAAIDAKGHALTLTLPEGHVWIDADEARLEQMVVNLLSNAVKYTDRGGHITLEAKAVEGELIISVVDDGVGLSSEMITSIFEPFIQVDASLDRSQGGLGIGLTLVETLAEMHGGQIEAVSEGLGHGSKFVLRLPLAAPPPDAAPPNSTRSESRGGLRVLAVDDIDDTVKGIARYLKNCGHEVRVASDGPSALTAARDFLPHVILLDIGLPGMNGYQVAARLREDQSLATAVLVALSGYGQERDRAKSREAGFDYHLVKPVKLDDLTTLLEELRSDLPPSQD